MLNATTQMYPSCFIQVRDIVELQDLNDLISESTQNSQINFEEVVKLRDIALHRSQFEGHLVVTMCGHYIADPIHGLRGDKSKNYSTLELMCPICKKPSNVQLPIYESSIVELINNSQKKAEIAEQEYMPAFIGEITRVLRDNMQLGWWRDTRCYSKRTLAQFELQSDHIQSTNDKIYEFMRDHSTAREKVLNKINFTNHSVLEEMADAIADMLRYSEIYGFVPTIQSFGKVYNSLYLSLRLCIITESEKLNLKPECINTWVFSSMMGHLLAILFSSLETENFVQLDLNALFCRAAVLAVGFF